MLELTPTQAFVRRGSARPLRAQVHRRGYAEEKKIPTPEQVQDRATVGVFTPRAAAIFLLTGAALLWYFQKEKERINEAKLKERKAMKIGRANIGSPFELLTHNNELFSDKDLLGKWSLVYFGFTNCPNICPAELDKMGAAVDAIQRKYAEKPRLNLEVLPIFVSVDPARDDVPAMKRYIAGKHETLNTQF
jgi:protein SCO1